jgi:[ribosomal protein S5]-alanine N-acetyltransferase
MIPGLGTERLLLRPLELADAPAIQALFPVWEIVRFLSDTVPWPYPGDGALTYCRDVALPAMARGEAWHWSLRLRTDPGTLIGCISLMAGPEENRGFWLGLPWQGRGLMTEAARAVTDYWFDVLGRPVLRIPKASANEASRRISLREGMRVVARESRNYVSGSLATDLWELRAEDWRQVRGSSGGDAGGPGPPGP